MKRLKDFFNAEDLQGNTHNGFVASLALPTSPVFNAVTVSILDDYIFNRLSWKLAQSQWTRYLDKSGKIDATFYSKASNTLQAFLVSSNDFYALIKSDFKALSFEESETMIYGATTKNNAYGARSMGDVYGARSTSDVYGSIAISIERGNDTRTLSSEVDTTQNSVYPFDAAGVAQAKDKSTFDKGDETTTQSYGDQTHTTGSHTDTHTEQSRTDTHTENARTDTETNATHTDTKTSTRVAIMTPEKYFEIMQELTRINAYTILAGAVDDCFCLDCF